MEQNFHSNCKSIYESMRESIREAKEEMCAMMKELILKFEMFQQQQLILPDKQLIYGVEDQKIIQEKLILPDKQLIYGAEDQEIIQEEDLIEKVKLILPDKQLIHGVEYQEIIQEEVLIEKEKLILPDKQLVYGVEEQKKQRWRFVRSLQRMANRNRGLQRLRWCIWIQMILQVIKRDLLFGREALLLISTWQRKKPRIRFKKK